MHNICDDSVSKLRMIKSRGHQFFFFPLHFSLWLAIASDERRALFFFIFLKIERRTWIITEITNPLSTRLHFVVEIRGFYEPSLLKLQALQKSGAQSFDVFPKLHFEKPRFFPHILSMSRFLTYILLKVCWSRSVSPENYVTRHAHFNMMKRSSK